MSLTRYYRTLSRQPKITQGTRFAVVTSVPHRFTPMPGMSGETIAFEKGREAKSLGGSNPYPPQSPLAAKWTEGYNAAN